MCGEVTDLRILKADVARFFACLSHALRSNPIDDAENPRTQHSWH